MNLEEERPAEGLYVTQRGEVTIEGVTWNVIMTEINKHQGLTVILKEPSKEGLSSGNFYLDYPNIFTEPGVARIHMMPSADSKVSLETRVGRLQLFAKAIKAFDSLMTSDKFDRLDTAQITRMVTDLKTPRIETVVASTGNDSIRRMLTGLGFVPNPEPPHDIAVPWNDMVSLARRAHS